MKIQRTFTSMSISKMAFSTLIYLTANFLSRVSCQDEQGLTLKLPQGEVRGTFEIYKRDNNDEVTYSVFRGIPYAKPPVGSLRLKDPEIHDDWSAIHDASKFGSVCPQWDSEGKMVGDENCLYLNIYTPLTKAISPSSATYPVMVFIHGGKFQEGSSNPYHQHRIVNNEIVLVTFNYRLGVLGFLSTGDEVCPGNLGLKDQVFALKWIRDYIPYFGGDSKHVTLFGQGAGAVSVFLHILSNQSQDLFHRAITQSGSPLCDWTVEEDPRSYASEVARKLGCSTKSSTAIIECIREKPLKEVLEAQKYNKTFGDFPLRAVPVVERGGFLPDSPSKLLVNGTFKPIPLISGINKDDGAILYPLIRSYEDVLKKKNSSFLLNQLIPSFLLNATDIRDNIKSVAQAVYFHYFNGKVSTNITQVLQSFVNMSTDAMFASCNYKTLESYSAKGATVYMYTFEYKGQYSMLGIEEGNKFEYDGVSHGDELLYLFNIENAELSVSSDKKKKEQFNFLWASFAKSESFPVSPEYPRWEPYNSETKYYYKIDTNMDRLQGYKQREIDFWLNHLPALANITCQQWPTEKPDMKYAIGAINWLMFAIIIILLILLIIAGVILWKKSKSQYVTTKSEDK